MDSFLFEKCILKNFNHQPTLDQESGINKLARFIFYDKKKAGLVIKGYAGTGKTTMISSLVKACDEKKMKIVLLAPTGRAAKVMSNYSQKESSTIHRHIYNVRQKKEGYFFSLAKNKSKNTLFVIDEASMIPGKDFNSNTDMFASSLLSDLISYIYSGQGCKAIFVGDHAQLPPVGWDTSPALDVQYLNELLEADFYQFELQQVVRQAEGSGILNEATILRNNIENEIYNLNISTNVKDVQKHQEKKRGENRTEFNAIHAKNEQKHKEKKRGENKTEFNAKNAENVQKCREKLQKDSESRIKVYREDVMFGRIFECICCHRKLFDDAVSKIKDEEKYKKEMEQKFPGLYKNAINEMVTKKMPKGENCIAPPNCCRPKVAETRQHLDRNALVT